GEHQYVKENLFPAMKKYADNNFVFFDKYKVLDYGNIVSLARQYGKDTKVIEIHYDSFNGKAQGGHVIIHKNFRPDAMDLRLRDAIKSMVGTRFSFRGEAGISGRSPSELGNVRMTANGGVNYRLVELGFGDNKRDADILLNRTDEYAKKLVEAIKGSGATVKPST